MAKVIFFLVSVGAGLRGTKTEVSSLVLSPSTKTTEISMLRQMTMSTGKTAFEYITNLPSPKGL